MSYEDENIAIKIEKIRASGPTVYIADIRINEAGYLKTALASNKFGRNIYERTSSIAGERNAIFAINGDYYGFRDEGYVLRNGTLYRADGSGDALIMDTDGNFICAGERDMSAGLVENARQIWSFGPVLINNGEVCVEATSEITGRSSVSNPRTAIGQIAPLHYVAIVSEGRTPDNKGLTLFELAGLFEEYGCVVAYNLDGGGSATMWFNGKVINNPTTNGRRIEEREVSDIVYIGYE
jgi:exopolysaccharide biosynthesis protein